MSAAAIRSLLGGILGIAWLAASSAASAQGGSGLLDLLEEVRTNKTLESRINDERERRFRERADEQRALQREAEAEVARQEALRVTLKQTFDDNETQLAQLQDTLDQRIGDLGELFGVFRQSADDAQTALYNSLITVEHPERKAVVASLAESDEVPTIPQMRALWQLLMQEIAHSGEISRFAADIIQPSGDQYQGTVTRVGAFNLISGDKYLNYLPDADQLVELPRQPQSHVRASAGKLSAAAPGAEIGFYIDPSRGALLGLLVQAPSLLERVEQGKAVGYAIIVVGVVGLLIVLERFFSVARVRRRIKVQLADLDHPNLDNPLGRVLNVYYENKHLDLEAVKRKLDEVVFKDVSDIRRGLPLIKVLAAVAPLMGLLGTVTGMIGTFQAITLFGTGDPKLMAGGISQALITTVLGLVTAIPLLLTHSLLANQVTATSKVIAEQSAGMLAKKAEADAELRA